MATPARLRPSGTYLGRSIDIVAPSELRGELSAAYGEPESLHHPLHVVVHQSIRDAWLQVGSVRVRVTKERRSLRRMLATMIGEELAITAARPTLLGSLVEVNRRGVLVLGDRRARSLLVSGLMRRGGKAVAHDVVEIDADGSVSPGHLPMLVAAKDRGLYPEIRDEDWTESHCLLGLDLLGELGASSQVDVIALAVDHPPSEAELVFAEAGATAAVEAWCATADQPFIAIDTPTIPVSLASMTDACELLAHTSALR